VDNNGDDEEDDDAMVPASGMKEVGLYMASTCGVSQLTLSTDYHLSLVEDAAAGKNIYAGPDSC
jgi:hypothetical protein